MEYRYGYVEMRAKIPYRTGVWPSFWMQSAATLGGRQNYDYMVEIDMLEVFGHKSDLYCNVHKWYSGSSNMATTHGITHIAAAEDGGVSGFLSQLFGRPVGEEKRTVSNPENWHTYGFAWDANYMSMYVDRELFRVYDITSATTVFGSDNGGKDKDMSGFNDPLYIIFNNHIFTENASWKPHTITGSEATSLPATYSIDYVRLYQGTETNTQLWTK
jgi:beta-glucanase (GH16 family)